MFWNGVGNAYSIPNSFQRTNHAITHITSFAEHNFDRFLASKQQQSLFLYQVNSNHNPMFFIYLYMDKDFNRVEYYV